MAEPLLRVLGARVRSAVDAAFGPGVEVPGALVQPARDPRHGDYSSPVALALARSLGSPPMELAERLAAALDVADMSEAPVVTPPGFVNLRLRPEWLASRVAEQLRGERLGLPAAPDPHLVVIDYSAPNVAKEMHVGHLRSTVIGDCLAEVFDALGHEVEGVNHVGDWGTQFGMLIAHLEDVRPEALTGVDVGLGDVVALYREANTRFQADEGFRERARRRVVGLQSGEPAATAAWQALVELSRRENARVYELLGVTGLVERGESFYQSRLPEVVAELEEKGLVVVDHGAKCVFVDGFTNKEGQPLPLIVQKADGGYNYATTDLAAVRHRVVELGARTVLYVIAAEQSQHLEMVFAVARMAGWVPDGVTVEHVPFGLVLGEGGKRLRTRTGETVSLVDLLEEAVARARSFVVERASERGEEIPADVDEVARAVGIGAVKYADLRNNRVSNYEFSYDRMLTLKGDTAPYLQYAYARMRSILREAGEGAGAGAGVLLDTPEEVALAKRLAELGDVIDRVVADRAPNHLCAHLYELSQAYNVFYERCPVLRSDEPLRSSRLALCAATAESLRLGLGLLGIEVLERI